MFYLINKLLLFVNTACSLYYCLCTDVCTVVLVITSVEKYCLIWMLFLYRPTARRYYSRMQQTSIVLLESEHIWHKLVNIPLLTINWNIGRHKELKTAESLYTMNKILKNKTLSMSVKDLVCYIFYVNNYRKFCIVSQSV